MSGHSLMISIQGKSNLSLLLELVLCLLSQLLSLLIFQVVSLLKDRSYHLKSDI
jgi:hypothetical protein